VFTVTLSKLLAAIKQLAGMRPRLLPFPLLPQLMSSLKFL